MSEIVAKNSSYQTRSVGKNFVEVEPVIIEETAKTRIVFEPQIDNFGIRGSLVRYRKDENGTLIEPVKVNFNQIPENSGVRILLKTETTRKLYEVLSHLASVHENHGPQYGEHTYTILEDSDDKNLIDLARRMKESGVGEKFWEYFSNNEPDLANTIAMAQITKTRRIVVEHFSAMINDPGLAEPDWQRFFDENKWIFGYGLQYRALDIISSQVNYGGSNLYGRGEEKGDYLTATSGSAKFTCLVEIKKPNTPLLEKKPYRNGAYQISSELSGAIAQIQANCNEWELEGARSEVNRDIAAKEEFMTVKPHGIVVIGNLANLDNRGTRTSFELFRAQIHEPEIITYDELLERCRLIIGNLPDNVQSAQKIDDDF